MCLTIGAQRVASLAGNLEANAAAIAINRDDAGVREIAAQLDGAIAALQQLVDEAASPPAISGGSSVA